MEFQNIKPPFQAAAASEFIKAMVVDAEGKIVAAVSSKEVDSQEEETRLAQLFAAALDLLEALEGILECVNVRIDDPRIQKFDAARAAIAKAYGKTKD